MMIELMLWVKRCGNRSGTWSTPSVCPHSPGAIRTTGPWGKDGSDVDNRSCAVSDTARVALWDETPRMSGELAAQLGGWLGEARPHPSPPDRRRGFGVLLVRC